MRIAAPIRPCMKAYFIKQKFTTYVNGYYKFVRGELNQYDARKYRYTTLKYFQKELNIQ